MVSIINQARECTVAPRELVPGRDADVVRTIPIVGQVAGSDDLKAVDVHV